MMSCLRYLFDDFHNPASALLGQQAVAAELGRRGFFARQPHHHALSLGTPAPPPPPHTLPSPLPSPAAPAPAAPGPRRRGRPPEGRGAPRGPWPTVSPPGADRRQPRSRHVHAR